MPTLSGARNGARKAPLPYWAVEKWPDETPNVNTPEGLVKFAYDVMPQPGTGTGGGGSGTGPSQSDFDNLDQVVTSLANAMQEMPVGGGGGGGGGGITGTGLSAQQAFDLAYYERKTFC